MTITASRVTAVPMPPTEDTIHLTLTPIAAEIIRALTGASSITTLEEVGITPDRAANMALGRIYSVLDTVLPARPNTDRYLHHGALMRAVDGSPFSAELAKQVEIARQKCKEHRDEVTKLEARLELALLSKEELVKQSNVLRAKLDTVASRLRDVYLQLSM